jgi:hypothetical protein
MQGSSSLDRSPAPPGLRSPLDPEPFMRSIHAIHSVDRLHDLFPIFSCFSGDLDSTFTFFHLDHALTRAVLIKSDTINIGPGHLRNRRIQRLYSLV